MGPHNREPRAGLQVNPCLCAGAPFKKRKGKKRHSWRLLTLWPLPGLRPCYWNNGSLKKRGPLIKQQISKHSYPAERKKTGPAISPFIVLLNGIVYSAGTKTQLISLAENNKCTNRRFVLIWTFSSLQIPQAEKIPHVFDFRVNNVFMRTVCFALYFLH